MVLRRALPTLVLIAAALTPRTVGADPSLEAQVMSKIRAYHSGSIAVHSGLLGAARSHSQGMSSRGGLDHNGADARVNSASPDPMETNGSPDDGFGVASWCENVTYVANYFPYSEVAQRIFNAWEGTGAHGRCMKEGHRNVGAIGIHYDGEFYWATFIAQVDKTPPGGSPPPAPTKPKPAGKDEPQPAPAASQPPAEEHEPAAQPEAAAPATAGTDDVAPSNGITIADEERTTVAGDAEPARVTADAPAEQEAPRVERIRASDVKPPLGYGWQELAAVSVLLALATLLLRRLRERPSEVEGRDRVSLAQIEPVRPSALCTGVERHVVATSVPRELREMIVEPLAVPARAMSGARHEVVDVQDATADEVRHDAVPRDRAALAGVE